MSNTASQEISITAALEEAIAKQVEAMKPSILAERKRAEAAKLLAEADALAPLAPTKTAADFEREAARENPEAYVRQ
jgi:hypothetical protein